MVVEHGGNICLEEMLVFVFAIWGEIQLERAKQKTTTFIYIPMLHVRYLLTFTINLGQMSHGSGMGVCQNRTPECGGRRCEVLCFFGEERPCGVDFQNIWHDMI